MSNGALVAELQAAGWLKIIPTNTRETHRVGPRSVAIVLMHFCMNADADHRIWHGLTTIAEDTGEFVRTVRNAIAVLVAEGLVSPDGKVSRANRYRVNVDAIRQRRPVDNSQLAGIPATSNGHYRADRSAKIIADYRADDRADDRADNRADLSAPKSREGKSSQVNARENEPSEPEPDLTDGCASDEDVDAVLARIDPAVRPSPTRTIAALIGSQLARGETPTTIADRLRRDVNPLKCTPGAVVQALKTMTRTQVVSVQLATPELPPWCGQCDEAKRWIEDPEDPDGALIHCPACSPETQT
jgi:hypothetical protein